MTGLVEVGRCEPTDSGTADGASGVLDGRDTDRTTGRLLSLTELQRALQVARSANPTAAPAGEPVGGTPSEPTLTPDATAATPPAAATSVPSRPGRAGAAAVPADPGRAGPASNRTRGAGTGVVVVGVHGGAGASTVALALADAAAAAGRPVHLVSSHAADSCGLLAVPHVELGAAGRGWRRGRRGDHVLIDRRSSEQPATSWPSLPVASRALAVLDCPRAATSELDRAAVVLLVCRPTVPGVQRTEHALQRLLAADPPFGQNDDVDVARARRHGRRAVLLACVGPARWPREVAATAGPHLQQLQRDGRVVCVPLDRQLAVTGPGSGPLPRAVLKAGRALLQLVDADVAAYRPTDHPDVVPAAPGGECPRPQLQGRALDR